MFLFYFSLLTLLNSFEMLHSPLHSKSEFTKNNLIRHQILSACNSPITSKQSNIATFITIQRNTLCYSWWVIFLSSNIVIILSECWIIFGGDERKSLKSRNALAVRFKDAADSCGSVACRVQQEVLAACAPPSSSSSNPAAAPLSVGDSHGPRVRLSGEERTKDLKGRWEDSKGPARQTVL